MFKFYIFCFCFCVFTYFVMSYQESWDKVVMKNDFNSIKTVYVKQSISSFIKNKDKAHIAFTCNHNNNIIFELYTPKKITGESEFYTVKGVKIKLDNKNGKINLFYPTIVKKGQWIFNDVFYKATSINFTNYLMDNFQNIENFKIQVSFEDEVKEYVFPINSQLFGNKFNDMELSCN